jgi:hypothetical protein
MSTDLLNPGDKTKLDAVSGKQPETMRETMNLAAYANHLLHHPDSDNEPQIKLTFTEEESRALATIGDEFQAKVLRNALIRRKLEEADIIDLDYRRFKKEYDADPEGSTRRTFENIFNNPCPIRDKMKKFDVTFTEEEAKELNELHDAICNLSDEEFRAWGKEKGYE